MKIRYCNTSVNESYYSFNKWASSSRSLVQESEGPLGPPGQMVLISTFYFLTSLSSYRKREGGIGERSLLAFAAQDPAFFKTQEHLVVRPNY